MKVRSTFPLVLILLLYMIFNLYIKKPTRIVSYILIVFLLLSSLFGVGSRFIVYKQYTHLFPYKEKIYVSKELSEKYNELFIAVEKNIPESEKLFVFPYNPMLYFILDRQNPTRYSELMGGAMNQNINSEIINNLQDVNYLVYDEHMYIDGKMFKDFAYPLYKYINENYKEIYKIDERTSILKRK